MILEINMATIKKKIHDNENIMDISHIVNINKSSN
jgi:hypothetical protein